MHINDLAVMGGELMEAGRRQLSVMLIRIGLFEDDEQLACQDHGVQQRLIRAEILPWDITMSPMFFCSTKTDASH